MNYFEDRHTYWERSITSKEISHWEGFLEGLPDCDLLPFVADLGKLIDWTTGQQIPLARWLTQLLQASIRDIHHRMRSAQIEIRERLALVTFSVLIEKIRGLVWRSQSAIAGQSGALVYYTDLLQCAMLLAFDVHGERVEFQTGLAVPQPHAYLDPVQVLGHIRSRADVDLVKTLLASPRRLVAHRNLLVEVDRTFHKGVFGPTIDTLYLCDWLNARIRLRREWRDRDSGPQVLEVGCGSGLILASFAPDYLTPGTHLEAVDVDPRATHCTFENLRRNADHRDTMLSWATLSTGSFDPARHPLSYDFILCNPPYIPDPPFWQGERAGSEVATHGTSLIELVADSAPTLLKPDGKLMMVSSRLAEREIVEGATTSGLTLSIEAARKVPFDIQGMDRDHLQWLVEERGLTLEDGSATHEIVIYRMESS